MMTASTADARTATQVTSCAPRSLIQRPKKPAMIEAISGRKMAATGTRASAFHPVDVFDGDGAAVAEIDDQDRQTDRRLGRGDGQHEHREHLADEVIEEGREGDEVDVDGEQDQLDRHQDDDDVAAVEEDAENAEREKDRRNDQIMREADLEQHLL